MFCFLKCAEIPIFIVFFEHQPKIAQKMAPQKNDNFWHFPKHRLKKKKKNVLLATPLLTKKCFFFVSCLFGNQEPLMLNKKHNLKSGKSKDTKKELETKKGRKLKKRENTDEGKTLAIE